MSRKVVLAIASKEFTENVLSRRFQIALLLATLLMATSVITLGLNHKEDEAAHQIAQAEQEESGEVSPFNRVGYEINRVLKAPNPLAIFSGGSGEQARRTTDIQQDQVYLIGGGGSTPQSTGGSDSPTSKRFDPLDLGFVSVVIMTFMAVIFAYDAVSGERERGTLKLMLTNPVPKDSVLLGKYLGGMASVLLPFGISVVVGLTIFQFMGIHLSWDEWGRLFLIILLFVPLASAFYLLGLLFSSLFKRSNTSLLALLLVWLLLVFGAGNVSAAAAKTASDTTTDADLMRQFQAIRDDQQSRAAVIHEELFPLYSQMGPNGTLPPDTQARVDDLQKQLEDIYKEAQQQRLSAVDAARRAQDRQLRIAETIAMVSPAEAYRSLATSLARTDYWSFKDTRDQAELYAREVERQREEWQRDQMGGGGVFIGGTTRVVIGVPGGGPISSLPVDQFQPPEFNYQAASVREQVTSGTGIVALFVLMLYNLGAFIGAYTVFVRYDVR